MGRLLLPDDRISSQVEDSLCGIVGDEAAAARHDTGGDAVSVGIREGGKGTGRQTGEEHDDAQKRTYQSFEHVVLPLSDLENTKRFMFSFIQPSFGKNDQKPGEKSSDFGDYFRLVEVVGFDKRPFYTIM